MYNRFRSKYFKESHLPEWGDFDFRWTRCKKNSALVDVGPKSGEVRYLELNQKNAWSEKSVAAALLHELIHMQGDPFLSHGKAFWMDVDRIMKLGAAKEFF